jgi:hypothetical protein
MVEINFIDQISIPNSDPDRDLEVRIPDPAKISGSYWILILKHDCNYIFESPKLIVILTFSGVMMRQDDQQ